MKINVVAVGRLKERYLSDAVQEYKKRISKYANFDIIELDEGKSLEEEGKEILKRMSGYTIITDIGGELLTSRELAKVFSDQMVGGKSEFTVVIGSSEGLCDKVKEKADLRISFGRVTYPHQLMRVIVAEQVYRILAINNNLTYHK